MESDCRRLAFEDGSEKVRDKKEGKFICRIGEGRCGLEDKKRWKFKKTEQRYH